ncbi:MAG: methyltransferase domain-containing protein [Bacteroidetes bacterium]|nr:methyltransferase domain-containing protein [Bacteroidota bacterium]
MKNVEQAFDLYATNYDEEFTSSFVGKAQRNVVYHNLNSTLDKENAVLEVNCGTGEDALWLSPKVNSVIATDISASMINTAKIKLQKTQLDNVKLEISSYADLSKKFLPNSFDVVFSNFGGLNCIDEHEFMQAIDAMTKLLKPKGKLVFVIMGRFCLVESLYFLFKLNLKKIFRRLSRSGISTTINDITFNTYYYSPKKIKQLTGASFKMLRLRGVGILLPPSYLSNKFSSKLTNIIYGVDLFLSRFSWSAYISDHYYIELEKTK